LPIKEHREKSKAVSVDFCLVVTSDSVFQGKKQDKITPLVQSILTPTKHRLKNSVVVPNTAEDIRKAVREGVNRCDVVIITGGTGIGPKDISVDVLKEICLKELPGFGELFRYLTYSKHGWGALASRATGCVAGNSLVFAVPGSPDAVSLALEQILLKEVPHLIYELRGR